MTDFPTEGEDQKVSLRNSNCRSSTSAMPSSLRKEHLVICEVKSFEDWCMDQLAKAWDPEAAAFQGEGGR